MNTKEQLKADIKDLQEALNSPATPEQFKADLQTEINQLQKSLADIEAAEAQAASVKTQVAKAKATEKKVRSAKTKARQLQAKAKLAQTEKKAKAAVKVAVEKQTTASKKIATSLTRAKEILAKASKKVKAFNAGKGERSLQRDIATTALAPGKRISANGNVYYERRSNRADISAKKRLEDGGNLFAKGGQTGTVQSRNYNQSADEKRGAKPPGWRYTNAGAAKLGVMPYYEPIEEHIEKYRHKKFKKDGKIHRYLYMEARDDKSDKDYYEMLEYGGSINYTAETKSMLEAKAKEISHHIAELNEILKEGKDVPTWVLTKIQRASTDLADITHYMDGKNIEGYEHGGDVEQNLPAYFGKGENIDVFGYITNNFTICPLATKQFQEAVEKVIDEDLADDNKVVANLVQYAKLVDAIYGMEIKCLEEDEEMNDKDFESLLSLFGSACVLDDKLAFLHVLNVYEITVAHILSILDNCVKEEGEYAMGGRLKSALMRDRKYLSIQEHEQAYNRKVGNRRTGYNVKEDGRQVEMEFEKGGALSSIRNEINAGNLNEAGKQIRLYGKIIKDVEINNNRRLTASKIGNKYFISEMKDGETVGISERSVEPKSLSDMYFEKGGKVTFNDKVQAVKKELTNKNVPANYQKEYGKKYSAQEALDAAKKIIGAQKAKYQKK